MLKNVKACYGKGGKMMTTIWQDGISVITPTIRKLCISQILSNFFRQQFVNKELIIVINNNEISPMDFEIEKLGAINIHIYQLPENKSIGECLNMAIEKAKYNYIAKFDDDDYYASMYLQEMYNAFKREDCDVVCKQSIFYYLAIYGELMLLSRTGTNRRVLRGAGATIGAKKSIFNKIQFASLKTGTDTNFFLKCRDNKLVCYSTSSYNYLCYRSKDACEHTWKVTAEEIRNKCKKCSRSIMSYEEACIFIGNDTKIIL